MSLCIKSFLPKWLFGNGFVSLLPPFRKALKEIIIQNITDFQQQIGINPFAVENLVSVLPRATELLGQPRDATPLLSQFCLDDFPYMRFFVHRFAFAGALRGGQTNGRNRFYLPVLKASANALMMISKTAHAQTT